MPTLSRELRKALDSLYSIEDLVDQLGPPTKIVIEYAQGPGYWRPGEGRPEIVPVGPAEAQAMGICAAARVRGRPSELSTTVLHRSPCEWCVTGLSQLLQACDHATWVAQFVVAEFACWRFDNGVYRRSTGRAGAYDNPVWARHFASPRLHTRGGAASLVPGAHGQR